MIPASKDHKTIVVDILSKSFDENQSINYIVKQDDKRKDRIRHLMDYCFEMCLIKGQIFLSEDLSGCALIMQPERKAGFIETALLDMKLALRSIGLSRAGKVMKREKLIKAHQPAEPFYYLWFVGVYPDFQGKGIGSKLLDEIFQYYKKDERPFYLETSVLTNLPWYKKYGFEIINEIDIGYKLFQMVRK
jgi:ribosomal protein S18 acetylase RimI-like enzyme